MRICSIMISVQAPKRQYNLNFCAAARVGIYFECPTQVSHALLHPPQSQPVHAPGIESASIVQNAEQNPGGFPAHLYLYGAGLGVARAIIQRLLYYAINTG